MLQLQAIAVEDVPVRQKALRFDVPIKAGETPLMALRFLDADVNRDPLDLSDGTGDLDDLAMRNVAVGLKNHFPTSLL